MEETQPQPPGENTPPEGASAPESPSAPDPEETRPPETHSTPTMPLGQVPSGSLVVVKEKTFTVVGRSETHPGQIKVRGPSRTTAYFSEDIEAMVVQVA